MHNAQNAEEAAAMAQAEAEARASAALIGAAPDLLEAAKQALHFIQEHEDGLPPDDAHKIAYELQSVIDKATYTLPTPKNFNPTPRNHE